MRKAWLPALLLLVALSSTCLAQQDPFADHRRADGTLAWSEVLKTDPSTPARLKNFSLESFVRELARVVATGERDRVSEFFDGVVATDFYSNYGLFVVGATAAEVGYDLAYRRYLHRYLKPRFVSGVLRANVALATGLALAQLVNGDFQGKVFAISMGSLGLSAAAVEATLSRAPWVRRLHVASKAAGATRLLRVGGFAYQTAELAIVFFVGRLVENAYYAYSERQSANDALEQAAQQTVDAIERAQTDAEVSAALRTYADAWIMFRNSLYGQLFRDRLELLERLSKLARKAKLVESEIDRAAGLRDSFPGLPLDGFAARRRDQASERTERELDAILDAYLEDWREHFEEVYQENRTHVAPFAPVIAHLDVGDTRPHVIERFVEAHDDVSRNRLETYQQERSGLQALALLFSASRAEIHRALDRVKRLEQADTRFSQNESGLLPFTLSQTTAEDASGMVENLERK